MKKRMFFLLLSVTFSLLNAHKVDLIIFSFDRPAQLYALLESVERYIINMGDIHVIYRASDARYDRAYSEVFDRFLSVYAVKQSENPRADFKPLLLKSFTKTSSEYVCFAVDDIIVQDYIDCAHCIKTLRQTGAYGFYLRLGKNITYAYMVNKMQRIPPLDEVSQDVYAWTFSAAQHDWAYPNTVDMTIYRKKDIEQDLRSLDYQNPNVCEGVWCAVRKRIMDRKGLCYGHSKIVNLPLNRVQTEYSSNRNENSLSTQELLELFERGFKIDITPLHSLNNTSPHMAYIPTFIQR